MELECERSSGAGEDTNAANGSVGLVGEGVAFGIGGVEVGPDTGEGDVPVVAPVAPVAPIISSSWARLRSLMAAAA